jgi:phage terminase large subunit
MSNKIKTWRENPAQFVHEELKVEKIDKWQLEACEVFPSMDKDKIRISLQACAGPGKSAVLSWLGWNFLTCYGDIGEHPKGAAMSVSSDNLKDNLWAELAKWQSRSEMLLKAFTWTKQRIYAVDHPETWFISARSFPKTADAEEQGRTLSGLHSKYVLYLIDESGDINPAVLRSAEQGLSTGPIFGKILQAGNPTSQDGMLYAAATVLRHLWYIIRITGDPDDPKRSSRIGVEWARQQIETYGRDNPWVMAFILGQFPPGGINTLLGPDEVQAALGKHLREDQYNMSQMRIGVDVARFGDDRNIIFARQGLASFVPVEMRNARTNDIAARVMIEKNKHQSEMEFVDGTGGYGAGVIDALIQAGHSPQEIHFSGKPNDATYFNKRSEMWFEMAKWVKRGGALPNIASLQKELTTPTYTFHNGKFRVEEKDQIKKRLGFSPDIADALCLTFALPEMPKGLGLRGGRSGMALTDYDPFA